LPSAISLCQRRGLPAEFVVQIQHNGYEAETVAADQMLRQNSQVSTILGSIDIEHYHRVLNHCDAILLPYDPAMYRWRGSGLFAEAVMYGKPIVVTSRTAMEASARRGECIARTCRFDPVDLARGIAELCENFVPMASEAKHKAQEWSDNNSVRVFCQKILSFALPDTVSAADHAEELDNEAEEEVPSWPVLSLSQLRSVEARLSEPVAVQFTSDGLRRSRGLLLEAELKPQGSKASSRTLSLTLNGHELPPLEVTAKRQIRGIAGSYPYLGNGLPSVLKIKALQDGPGAVPILVHGIKFSRSARD